MAEVTRSTSRSDAESSSALKKKTGQIESKETARDVYMRASLTDPQFELATQISRDIHNRWGASTGQGVMRFILALLLMSGTAMAQVQNRIYQNRWVATLDGR